MAKVDIQINAALMQKEYSVTKSRIFRYDTLTLSYLLWLAQQSYNLIISNATFRRKSHTTTNYNEKQRQGAKLLRSTQLVYLQVPAMMKLPQLLRHSALKVQLNLSKTNCISPTFSKYLCPTKKSFDLFLDKSIYFDTIVLRSFLRYMTQYND